MGKDFIAIVLDHYNRYVEILACGDIDKCKSISQDWARDVYEEDCVWKVGNKERQYCDFSNTSIYILGTEFPLARMGGNGIPLIQLWDNS
jgi:hypothetical protein